MSGEELEDEVNYRKEARGRECMVRIPGVCNGNSETVVLAHLNGGGTGFKTDDTEGAWCCSACHDVIDGRAKSEWEPTTVELWHYHGARRTRDALRAEGKL